MRKIKRPSEKTKSIFKTTYPPVLFFTWESSEVYLLRAITSQIWFWLQYQRGSQPDFLLATYEMLLSLLLVNPRHNEGLFLSDTAQDPGQHVRIPRGWEPSGRRLQYAGDTDLVAGEKRSPLPRAGDCLGGQSTETRSKMRRPHVSWAELYLPLPNSHVESLNSQYLRMWPYLEIGFLKDN